ncbi:hypothetical protein UlMin_031183 [Ulmus minor]
MFDITFQVQSSTDNNQAQSSMSAMVATPNTVADNSWYLDSGVTHHMTQNVAGISNITPYTGSERVTIGNGKQIPISHVGASPCVVYFGLQIFPTFC